MRILWIGKAPADGAAGDEIFDRKTISALRAASHSVVTLYPQRVGRWHEIANLLRGIPHYRSRFASSANRRLVRDAPRDIDLAICSWEPLDVLLKHLERPVILIAHNITSQALPSMFPSSGLARIAAHRAGSWERRLYRAGTLDAIATLSCRDRDYVASLATPPHVLLTIPGMPPVLTLDRAAPLRRELVLSGTYDWAPKRRDVIAFARGYAGVADRLPVLAEALPAEAIEALPTAEAPDDEASRAAIRFGLITDRFEAGHKLKTLAYISRNQIVLSFADIVPDFLQVPDHDFFIRRLGSVDDIANIVSSFAEHDPIRLRNRFLCFQRHCAERFTWNAVAEALVEAAANYTRNHLS